MFALMQNRTSFEKDELKVARFPQLILLQRLFLWRGA